MTRIPRTHRWLGVPARIVGRAGRCWQPRPPGPPVPWARDSWGAGIYPVEGWPSFRRILPIPFATSMAALESWQLTGQHGELRLTHNVLRGPANSIPLRHLLD